MTNVVRWDPFSDLRQTMDRLFDEGFSRPWRLLASDSSAEGVVAVEMSETEHDIEVKASLPGVDPKDIEINVQNDVLTIRGEHRQETEEKKKDYYRRELRYGAFHRSLALPMAVETDKAEATFKNGILSLRLPKAAAVRPKQIKVQGAGDVLPPGKQ